MGGESSGVRLRLLQLSDSALPIGGYTHSWGLEAAIERRIVVDAGTLEEWVRYWLRMVLAPLEGVVAAAVHRSASDGDWASVGLANDVQTASTSPPSLRAASMGMGEQLLNLAATWAWSREGVARFEVGAPGARDRGRWNHAVVFGMLGAFAGATEEDALLAYLHQAALGVIGAGVRAVPVGHTHGQQVLAYLHEDITELAASLRGRSLDSAGGASPFYEVLCDEQTRLYSRLFRS